MHSLSGRTVPSQGGGNRLRNCLLCMGDNKVLEIPVGQAGTSLCVCLHMYKSGEGA